MFVFIVFVVFYLYFFFFNQKTAYEMRINDWSSDVCSSDLLSDDNGESFAASGLPMLYQAVEAQFAALAPLRLAAETLQQFLTHPLSPVTYTPEIGRASCRERVCQYV